MGQRVYFLGNTFPAKDRIKAMGGHWDGDARAWWVGAAKQADAEKLLASLNGPAASVGLAQDTPAGIVADKLEEAGRADEAAAVRSGQVPANRPPEDIDSARVYAQVEYKGRRYYVIAEQRDPQSHQPVRCRLTTLDPLPGGPFWADCADCNLVRTYQGREVWDGRRYSGKTRTEYQTIGGLRRFRDRQRQGERDGLPACAACGKRSDSLVTDLEDGLQKCRFCCDIPE